MVAVIQVDFVKAIRSNVLAIPLFIAISIYLIVLLLDILFDKDNTAKFERFLANKKLYAVYIIILVASASLNRII